MGTDSVGRDLLARTLVGTPRHPLALLPAAALVALVVGIAWGANRPDGAAAGSTRP